MASFYTQVTLDHDSALPEDRSVNTFSVVTADVAQLTELGLWHAELITFYNAIDGLLSSTLAGTGTIKSYNRADPEPRVATLDTPFTFNPAATTLPAEVAVCMSFQGVRIAGQPQARRRGRVFLGPLYGSMGGTTDGRPTPGNIAIIQNAGDVLVTASKAANGWDWSVWSPTDQDDVLVDNGWVDNAFDTQRRRGIRPTTRATFA